MVYDVRIQAVDALRVLRKMFKYRELEGITGLSIPTLWRYVKMKILPTRERANELLDKVLSEDVIKKIIERNIKIIDNSVVGIANLIYDVDYLKLFSLVAYRIFNDLEPTAIATVEVDGIPLAVMISDIFDSKLVVAKRRLDIGVSDYYEVRYISGEPPLITNLYIPSNVLGRNDRVLIVDDLLRSGKTSQALIRLIKRTKATPIGIYAVVALGSRWYEILKDEVSRIYVSYIIS